METLVEMLMEENKLQQKSRSCLVATCGHKGLKVRSMRREEEEEEKMAEKLEAWGACNCART